MNEKITIAVLVDALGWEFVSEGSFLDGLTPFRTPLRTVLGYSSGAIPSILTGRQVDEHGMWNLLYYSPASSPFRWTRALAPLPERLRESRYTRYLVKRISRKISGYTGYFSCYGTPVEYLRYYDICEKKDIYGPAGIEGSPTIFDELSARRVSHSVYSYHGYTDEEIFKAAKSDIESGRSSFYFLYLSELDAFLHNNRHLESGIRERLDWYETRIREVFRSALDRGPADLHVFSDHGMALVTGSYDLISEVGKLGFAHSRDYLAIYDSTMARFWFFNDRCRDAFRLLLSSMTEGKLLGDEDLRAERIKFDDNRYGEMIFLMNPGTVISPSYMGGKPMKGMHGFHPSHKSSTAMYMSSKTPVKRPHSITDIKNVLLEGLS
ncbi:MAG TPA: hypothetical protein DDW94_02875 [Deltaproteobacteria bacterium]|nr:MAG: hypothetical protein A2Z79_08970 [Deltaproteobacteria bacterium GWA2_55_82]OGQ64598.1 MAG: hypothetical protein A3I81_11235 [Deltaproteobacteria bacterium RIFCSPLOWO2_02_FULL_55_12]OIJ73696.1 MAG: hypothetical protein A2V21_305105 [Deltaproteobacteria bacterium GWC2_55_46]HBG45911.1 hypothetical protein [Deltaproteobacteria bacterium]HCY09670.1 hypothetical protein [Deltaproteobacteria bacterium]